MEVTDADGFVRKIEFVPAYNKVAEGYGRHGVEMRCVLTGPLAAVQFVLFTGWDHSSDRHTSDGLIDCSDGIRRRSDPKPYPIDIGYHARKPQYDGQMVQREKCHYLGGAPCYYDGSALRATVFFDVFTDQGEDALWNALREEYDARFVVGVPATVASANFGEMLDALANGLSGDDAGKAT